MQTYRIIGKSMKKLLSVCFLAIAFVGCGVDQESSSISEGSDEHLLYPIAPATLLTPGELCKTGDLQRYPEGIRYCKRDVATELKYEIIDQYDLDYGYKIRQLDRADFKIDHYIPLCAGGANTAQNLWPQHKSVYTITDPLEPLVCNLMKQGKLSQASMLKLIKHAKNNLESAPKIVELLERRLNAN
jgi:hypothetical protein